MPGTVRGRRRIGLAGALAAAIAVAGAAGCATYTDRMTSASLAAGAGDYAGSIASVNGLLGVSSSDQMPPSLGGDKPLLLLDRGMLQQATDRFEGSQRDLSAAEEQLELLDLGRNGLATLGSYLYSDSVKTYRVPPAERLALNSVNLLNYLARGDLSGAAVEARRFQVMRDYLESIRMRSPAPDRFGAYLSGFVFEKNGEGDRALRYYDEALGGGALASLMSPVSRLAASNPYRGSNLARILGGGGGAAKAAPAGGGSRSRSASVVGRGGGGASKATGAGSNEIARPAPAPSELLVVLALGRVPHRVPQRIAVGAAVGIAGAFLGDRDLDVLRYSATKVLVYPELVPTPSSLGPPSVQVNGRDVEVETLADLGSAIVDEYQASKPKILAAALARVAARAAVSEGVRVAGNQKDQAVGDVLSLLVEATMVALDKPDTRSWTMLPDRVLVARVPVAPGTQDVTVSFRNGYGATRHERVNVPERGWGTVVVTEPR